MHTFFMKVWLVTQKHAKQIILVSSCIGLISSSLAALSALYQLNQFTSGIIIVFFLVPRVGLFSVKIRKTFLAINNFFVNETKSG